MSEISQLFATSIRASAVIHFTGPAEVGTSIEIGDNIYTESEFAKFSMGLFKHELTAAASCIALAAAINADARMNHPHVSAFITEGGDSIVVVADDVGTQANVAVVTDSPGNVIVEDMSGGTDGRVGLHLCNYRVSENDVLAREITLPLPFAANMVSMNSRASTGSAKEITAITTIESNPDRVRILFFGAVDPAEGDVLFVFVN